MGRVYLPEEDLLKFGICRRLGGRSTRRDSAHCSPWRPTGRGSIHAGDELIPLIDEDSQPALWVLITIYRHLLEKIAQANYDVFSWQNHPHRQRELIILARGFMKRMA